MTHPSMKKHTFPMPDGWSHLPEELLEIISKKVENCFDAIHARSVCSSWRSAFPYPACLLRPTYSLPSFPDSCTLEKVPLFLFRVPTSPVSPCEFFLGGIGRDESEGHVELPSPLQCSVKMEIPGSDPTLMNTVDCQIIPLGHQYRLIGCSPRLYRCVAFLPLNKEGSGEGEFVVILNCTKVSWALRSAEMRWHKNVQHASYKELVTFKGRFYAGLFNGDIFVIDPYSLRLTPMMPPVVNGRSDNFLVPSGDSELFLVQRIIPGSVGAFPLTVRVSRLDEEAGKWTEVSELGGRVLFIGHFGNVSCSAKELPDGCGVIGNSVVFTNEPSYVRHVYGVHTGRLEDDINWSRSLSKNRVTIFSTSRVVRLRVDPSDIHHTLDT